MACEDRQLTEAQREAGYQQGRTGVGRAIRPFSGRPTLDNLIDYINRELFPAVRSTRDRVNDVYLPAVDNAPSANPLIYYFSTETGAADPTSGRIRLNASPQNTATVMRISEQNARLVDTTPWLEVMAGGATSPLGVVTLSDAINPGRFIRFDLESMTDQGVYWDLGVTPIESSHDDPFVDGGGLVVSFIPGVASDGVTVPAGSLTPIGANTVLGNPTASTAAPTEIAMPQFSVLIRSTGNITAAVAPSSRFLRSNTGPTAIGWGIFALTDLPAINNNQFIGNVSGAFASPVNVDLAQLAQDFFGIGFDSATHNFKLSDIITDHLLCNISGSTTTPLPIPFSTIDSTSIIWDGTSHTFQRAALTGDVTSAQNSNSVTINGNAVTDAMLRDSGPLSVIGRAANSTGDPADISAVAASDAVLRESGSTIGWGQVATAGIADLAVTNAKLANMVAGTVKGRLVTAGTGAVTDLTGSQQASNLRYDVVVDVTSTGTITSYAPTGFDASTTGIRISPPGNVTLLGMALATGQSIVIRVGRGSATTVTINHEDAGASAASERFNTPNNVAVILRAGEAALIRNLESRNNVIALGQSARVPDADYGDITVSGTGATWTIDNNVVSNAKLRDSVAVSVIGRSANSTGDPADIAAAANDRLLARTSDSLAFQQLTDGMVPTNTIALTKLANILDNRFLGNISGATGAVTATDFASLNSTSIIYESTGKTFIRQALTGDVTASQNSNATTITNGAVTNAKLRNSDSLSVIGNPTNAATVPSDITATVDGHVLRRSGTALGFGTVATAGITDAAVTLAKMADLAQSRIIGRAEGAGTGVPTSLTPAQVVAIIDGEAVTWTAAHSFTGATHTVSASGAVSISSSGSTVTATGGTQLILAAGTTIDANSPTRLQSSAALTGVQNNAATAANDLTLSSVGAVRFSGPPNPLTGMVAAATGQLVLLVNVHATDDMVIQLESPSSTAANRFAGSVTDRHVKPGEMALAWYDGTSSRWRLLCRDDVDL